MKINKQRRKEKTFIELGILFAKSKFGDFSQANCLSLKAEFWHENSTYFYTNMFAEFQLISQRHYTIRFSYFQHFLSFKVSNVDLRKSHIYIYIYM